MYLIIYVTNDGMLLAFKENLLRPQPRSTPPNATLEAFRTVPAVPVDLPKASSVFAVKDENKKETRGRWKQRVFDYRKKVKVEIATDSPHIVESRLYQGSPQAIVQQVSDDLNGTVQTRTMSLQRPPISDRPEVVIATTSSAQIPNIECFDSQIIRIRSSPGPANVRPKSEAEPELPTNPVSHTKASSNVHLPSTPETVSQTSLERLESAELSVPTQAKEVQEASFTRLRPLQRLSPSCYVAFDIPVDGRLQQLFNTELQQRLRSFLESLKLKNPAIMMNCVAASTKPDGRDIKPTILFLCLDSEQHKAISSALRQRMNKEPKVIPLLHYRYAVLVQETKFCSSGVGLPWSPGKISGKSVNAILQYRHSLCGIPCQLSDFAMGFQCTIGGLICIGGSLYALTTSHAFLGAGQISVTTARSSNSKLPIEK